MYKYEEDVENKAKSGKCGVCENGAKGHRVIELYQYAHLSKSKEGGR